MFPEARSVVVKRHIESHVENKDKSRMVLTLQEPSHIGERSATWPWASGSGRAADRSRMCGSPGAQGS